MGSQGVMWGQLLPREGKVTRGIMGSLVSLLELFFFLQVMTNDSLPCMLFLYINQSFGAFPPFWSFIHALLIMLVFFICLHLL
jgi:hypothetical protein